METCEHTGLSIPECSCPECLKRLLEEHAPKRAMMRGANG